MRTVTNLLAASALCLMVSCSGDPSEARLHTAIEDEARRQLNAKSHEQMAILKLRILTHRVLTATGKRQHEYRFEATVRYLMLRPDSTGVPITPKITGTVILDE